MSINVQSHNSFSREKAINLLQSGKLVVFPTETVYGIGAVAADDKAVASIFALKGRPSFNPLIVHVSSIAMAQKEVVWNERAELLAKKFWPGPLTLVLHRNKHASVSFLASAGGDTLAVRMPDNQVALALIEGSGKPLAAPSANRSGRVSPTSAQHVLEEFGDSVPLIIDGGDCKVGVESTVLDITGERPVLLRPGGITQEVLEEILNQKIMRASATAQGDLKSPGMLESHYAPGLPVRLNATSVDSAEALLAFGPNHPAGASRVINLSEKGDTVEAAARLFAALRELDDTSYTAIAVMPIPDIGLGVAINDRLRRAAAQKP